MPISSQTESTAFHAGRQLAQGPLHHVAPFVHEAAADTAQPVYVFNDSDGAIIELDLRGSVSEVLRRLPPPTPEASPETAEPTAPRGPGRPRLGVVAREVTLLPRHWDWLATQPGGASVALRKLVDGARKRLDAGERARQAREAAYRFMVVAGGEQPGFEDATRALFAHDRAGFDAQLAAWPADLRRYAQQLAAQAFGAPALQAQETAA
ncbi:MAG: hypothetical protein JWP29_1381 [Rhodoferax sp.]|nr:hypothetical protein [Rhodoferax sp.]